ncbi:MAG TPA: response regulator [bacterium]|nr:response regulator [bacterium]
MRILVVDDVGYNRIIVTKALQKHGFDVVEAASGDAALQMLSRDSSIGLVIADYMMPGMNGIELFKKASLIVRGKDAAAVPCPPFILLTAAQDFRVLHDAKRAGFKEVLAKPLDVERLLNAIRSVLGFPEESVSSSEVSHGDTKQGEPESKASKPISPMLQQAHTQIKQAISAHDAARLAEIKKELEGAINEIEKSGLLK